MISSYEVAIISTILVTIFTTGGIVLGYFMGRAGK